MTAPLQVSFVKDVREAIFREAKLRQLRPQVLVAAAMRGVLEGNLLDAVIDGEDARRLAGGHARDALNGLTLIQSGLVYLIGLHAGRDGAARLSLSGYQARMEGASLGGIQNALARLATLGLIRRRGTSSRLTPQAYALTPAGKAVYAALAGTDAEGGKG